MYLTIYFLVFSALAFATHRKLKYLDVYMPSKKVIAILPGEAKEIFFNAEVKYERLSWLSWKSIEEKVPSNRFEFELHGVTSTRAPFIPYKEYFDFKSACFGEKVGRGNYMLKCRGVLNYKSIGQNIIPSGTPAHLYLNMKDNEIGQIFRPKIVEALVLVLNPSGNSNTLPVDGKKVRKAGDYSKSNNDNFANDLMMYGAIAGGSNYQTSGYGSHDHGSSYSHDHGSSYFSSD